MLLISLMDNQWFRVSSDNDVSHCACC